MVGTSINKYRILQKIGEGGMATVYLGRHPTLDRQVAIKVLHPHLLEDSKHRQRFAREAKAIGQLKHSNILEIHDYSGQDAPECYIVTEFIQGCTLHRLLRVLGMLPPEVVAAIGVELAEALAYAHREHIIHRDLKPENVMLQPDGLVKLMDFGIARFLGESSVTMTNVLIGSPAYMSPEQALERPVDTRSDLFSLGALLFHLAAGRLPFAGSNPSIILRNIIEGNRPSVMEVLPSVSPRLADVIERLLQTDVEARFEDALQVAEALRAVLDEAELDPASPEWSLSQFVPDPQPFSRGVQDERWEQAVRESARAYEERLLIHLDRVLLARGRAAYQAGDHLSAQRLFNRLLAFNPEHPQVLELLASLHVGAPENRKNRYTLWALGVLVFAIGVSGWWLLKPDEIALDLTPIAPAEPASPRLSDEELRAAFPVRQGASEPEAVASVDPASPPPPDAPSAPMDEATDPVAAPPEPDAPRSSPGLRPDSADARGVATGPISPTGPKSGAAAPAPAAPAEDGEDGFVDAELEAKPAALSYGSVVVALGAPGWADVLIDGGLVGQVPRTNTFRVSPGDHTLILRNTHAEDYVESFSIGAGEEKTFKNIILRKKPVTVGFTDTLAGDCLIERNGTELGTLDELGRRLTLQNPSLPYAVRWTCPDGAKGLETLEGLTPGTQLTLPRGG